ncbi:MAG: sugar phosphate isomerase/epimerase [Opitutus sp.]
MKQFPANVGLQRTPVSILASIQRAGRLAVALALASITGLLAAADSMKPNPAQTPPNLWAHDNLIAWCAVPFDANHRGPEERAAMLARLGFKHFAYDWRAEHVPTFDAEIDALKKHDVNLHAWWFPFDATDPQAKSTLELFKRHNVHPQLWVMQSSKKSAEPLTDEQQISQNAERIAGLAKLAAPYGCKVGLYNHNGWFGVMDHQLTVLERLRTLGVTDVGIVYNFSHARDPHHDDTKDFPALWKKIQPYVMAVNVTGMRMEGQIIYPSQGDAELAMMRTIQESGWSGPVGVIAEKGGDAEVTLGNYLKGIDWLAAELKQPGSAGPRPFPPAP